MPRIIIPDTGPFSLDRTLSCGQVFRWEKQGMWWQGVIGREVVRVRQENRLLIFSGTVYFWLKPHLGTMKGPVLAYIIVITLMLSGAWSILGEFDLAGLGRSFIFSGAAFFYVSDLFVARDRFVKKAPINRFLGLPLYYTGQFLLAFSVGLL